MYSTRFGGYIVMVGCYAKCKENDRCVPLQPPPPPNSPLSWRFIEPTRTIRCVMPFVNAFRIVVFVEVCSLTARDRHRSWITRLLNFPMAFRPPPSVGNNIILINYIVLHENNTGCTCTMIVSGFTHCIIRIIRFKLWPTLKFDFLKILMSHVVNFILYFQLKVDF